ncbi:MAG: division plane positioning ATPase MipZ [Kiloniellaceae bacterium]
MIIEDDPSVSRSIELILKSQGHVCDIAESGSAGLECARDKKHDIIILDLTLPDMDGHKVLNGLRAARVHTPVLILSGRDDRDSKVKGLGIGADDYVTKPFDKDELIARIQAIVRRAKGKTPLLKAAALNSMLLARSGHASPWGFSEAYAPPQSSDIRVPPEAPAGGHVDGPAERIAPRPEDGAPRPSGPSPRLRPAKPRPGHAGRVIVLGAAKGGTGKSTTAMHLIVALLKEANRVGSLDLDCPQGTLTRYIENRRGFAAKTGAALPMPEHHVLAAGPGDSGRFEEIFERLVATCDHVVIDTPGHDTPLSRQAHARADVLVTPINDSFLDLDVLALVEGEPPRIAQLSHYSAMVLEARKRDGDAEDGSIDWIVLRNRLSNLDARNKRHMADVLGQMSQQIGFRVGPGLSERVIYRELFLSGLTLLDLPDAATGTPLTLSHVAARQELRTLLDVVRPEPRRPARPGDEAGQPRGAGGPGEIRARAPNGATTKAAAGGRA